MQILVLAWRRATGDRPSVWPGGVVTAVTTGLADLLEQGLGGALLLACFVTSTNRASLHSEHREGETQNMTPPHQPEAQSVDRFASQLGRQIDGIERLTHIGTLMRRLKRRAT